MATGSDIFLTRNSSLSSAASRIELYDEYATIAEQRCREAAVLRARYESRSDSKLDVFSCERNDQLGGSPCDLENNRDAQDLSMTPTSRSSLPHSI